MFGAEWWETEGIISFSPNFMEIFYMFQIFSLVALDSFATFSPNLSKFSGQGGGSVRLLCDILTTFSKFLSYWEGKGPTST